MVSGDVLARRDAGNVQARAPAAELREVHAVDRGRVRARVEMTQRVDVRRPVVAERDAEALVREVAVEIRRRVLEWWCCQTLVSRCPAYTGMPS